LDGWKNFHRIFSKLKNGNVSADDYKHAKSLYEGLNCQNLKQFNQIYNVLDAITTASVIHYRSEFLLRNTGLDIREFMSMSEFSKFAQLKSSREHPQLLPCLTHFELVK